MKKTKQEIMTMNPNQPIRWLSIPIEVRPWGGALLEQVIVGMRERGMDFDLTPAGGFFFKDYILLIRTTTAGKVQEVLNMAGK